MHRIWEGRPHELAERKPLRSVYVTKSSCDSLHPSEEICERPLEH